MNIEAIGTNLTSSQLSGPDNTTLSQEDFIKLFMAQLNFQDPLEPVDNAQFLAQMAQFTSVEQTRLTNEKMDSLLALNTTEQATTLLGKTVEVKSGEGTVLGVVRAIEYTSNGPGLTVDTGSDEYLRDVPLASISVITEDKDK
ncbi:hypothetical protein M2H13_18865 [Vibrio vulnificus]|nr:hypothetical protein [Vibrio vulnificus]EIZ1408496.1 hypothetical protein [Vibrio vulnificus]EIZ1412265.1 hypothetical protein [Vibrio vulnificus]EJA3293441.1 hypothetical protein [Vibrio vulnificus]EJA3297135.1 hypothetical protein [Vibrio vulnificus]